MRTSWFLLWVIGPVSFFLKQCNGTTDELSISQGSIMNQLDWQSFDKQLYSHCAAYVHRGESILWRLTGKVEGTSSNPGPASSTLPSTSSTLASTSSTLPSTSPTLASTSSTMASTSTTSSTLHSTSAESSTHKSKSRDKISEDHGAKDIPSPFSTNLTTTQLVPPNINETDEIESTTTSTPMAITLSSITPITSTSSSTKATPTVITTIIDTPTTSRETTSTLPERTTVGPETDVTTTDPCNTFHLTYDNELSSCICIETIERDVSESDCLSYCLSNVGCKSFVYSWERMPMCKLYAYNSNHFGGPCKRKRTFDWNLHEIVKDCRQNLGENCNKYMNGYRNAVMLGCGVGFPLGNGLTSISSCKSDCSGFHWCRGVWYKRGKCVGYSQTPILHPTTCNYRKSRSERGAVSFWKDCQ